MVGRLKLGRVSAALALSAMLVAGCSGGGGGLDAPKQAELVKQLRHGIVIVEFELKTDKGEYPAGGWYENMPFGLGGGEGYSELISQERPLEAAGFLVSPTLAVTGDPELASRFIKGIQVRVDNEVVPAKIVGYALDRRALFIELEKEIQGATPYRFDKTADGPWLALSHGRVDGAWGSTLQPFVHGFAEVDAHGSFLSVAAECLVVNADGQVAGVCMEDRVPADDSWKGDPADWTRLSADEVAKRMDALDKDCAKSVVRVKLNFRSPPKGQGRRFMADDDGGGDGGATEANVPGLVTAPDRVLVLSGLKPGITARLERVTVCTDNGDVPATFLCTLTDYEGLVVVPETPAGAPAKLSMDNDVASMRGRLLFVADVRIQGENRVVHITPQRFGRFTTGWRRNVYAYVNARGESPFIFDDAGALVVVPLSRRIKGQAEQRWRDDGGEPATPVTYLRNVFSEPACFADSSNIPLSEEQENRLAWLGVDLQPLSRDLARLNKISDLTRDGETGAIVSSESVPGSPAQTAGLKPGDILLRVHIEGFPAPVDVRVEEHALGGRAFPWERYDEIGDQYFEMIPRPWPGLQNSLMRILTEAGFGKKFDLELWRDGKTLTFPMVVTESPMHYDTAPKFKSKPLGMTVRNLTFEVRKYFQRKDEEPGVIISNIEPGSKAAVSGLKPYEVITAVNEKPIANVKDFEQSLAGAEELRLNVLRFNKTRIVKVSMKGGDTAKPRPPMPRPSDDE